jgi:8-oxo-dGTP pyrophosphatase MutT (NUDIX family)
MLPTIVKNLQKYPLSAPRPDASTHRFTAAVLVALLEENDEPEVILTQRALHLTNHAGEVAFPGGMWDLEDRDLLHTALREAHEEIGLEPASVNVIATLPSASPKRRSLAVTPFVGLLSSRPVFVADPSEIGAIFSVPLRRFMDPTNYDYIDISHEGTTLQFPCLHYQQYPIWGFTLRVITDILNETLDAGLDLIYPSHQEIQLLRSE